MRALYYERFGETPVVASLPDPEPTDGGVVIAVKATGLCRSDWHGWMGHDPDIRLPHVPGHEFAWLSSPRSADTSPASRPATALPFLSSPAAAIAMNAVPATSRSAKRSSSPASPIGVPSPNMSRSIMPTRTSCTCLNR